VISCASSTRGGHSHIDDASEMATHGANRPSTGNGDQRAADALSNIDTDSRDTAKSSDDSNQTDDNNNNNNEDNGINSNINVASADADTKDKNTAADDSCILHAPSPDSREITKNGEDNHARSCEDSNLQPSSSLSACSAEDGAKLVWVGNVGLRGAADFVVTPNGGEPIIPTRAGIYICVCVCVCVCVCAM
jgi:hypothetical protein